MYNSLQLLKRYLGYYLTASSGKGHGIHSPFVYDFIKQVLRDKKENALFAPIEFRRNILIRDNRFIEVADLGAGSATNKRKKRKVADIARSSLKSKKYARLLYRIAKHYQPKEIIELGTSFGITTAYLASANSNSKIISCEGDAAIAGIARQNFAALGINNIELVEGDFAETLPMILSTAGPSGLYFIDGNHRKESTISYFRQIIHSSNSLAILVFDDIHWSRDMEEAWTEVKTYPEVRLTIDLFFMGLVFLRCDFKIKQDFRIRF